MQNVNPALCFLIPLLWLFSANVSELCAQPRKPNFILILADDLGYGDLSCYGSTAIRTPNLDRMAKEGIRLTDFITANPVCSPSRAALLTGRYPARVGVPRVLFPKDTTGLPRREVTIAEVLKGAGYATACIGKWHLGHLAEFLPTSQGFDYYFGIPYSNDMSPTPVMRNTDVIEEPAQQDTLMERYTEEALRFIAASKDRSFFLYLPHTMPHIPLHATPRFRGKSAAGLYGDVVQAIDWSVGELLKALKKHGIENHTLVMFSSDNGPWYEGSPGRLRGRKGSTLEGGVRVPFIARWPDAIPKGLVSAEPVSGLDIFPTILAAAGLQKSADISLDGETALEILTGKSKKRSPRLVLYFDDIYVQAARWGKWKIQVARYDIPRYNPAARQQKNVAINPPELYNLEVDPDESYNLAAEHPQLVQELKQKIEALLKTLPEEIQKAYSP